MKKVVSLLAVAGIIAAASAAMGATIVGSKHDLSGTAHGNVAYNGTSTQICVYCHAPHNANLSLPLWNRNNPAGNLFTLYSGINMANVSFKTGFTSDSTSLFCMSCHDGVTTMDAVHNAGATDGTGVVGNVHTATSGVYGTSAISGAANLTRDLRKTHPINFPVGTTDTQGDLNVGTGSTMGPGQAALNAQGYTMGKTFPLFKTTADAGMSANRATTNRSLECGSCHAVHDSAFKPFLRDTMAGSQLCLGCHNK